MILITVFLLFVVKSHCNVHEIYHTEGIHEVEFDKIIGGVAKATSEYDAEVPAIRGFMGPGYTWHSAAGTKLPQCIWYEFPHSLTVVKFSFQSRTDHRDECKGIVRAGPSKYKFWGSNAIDCSSTDGRVTLHEDNSGIPFTMQNIPKVVSVPTGPSHSSYRCYGFTVTDTAADHTFTSLSNIRFWYNDEVHRWSNPTLGCIKGHMKKKFITKYFEECKDACENERNFVCRSVEYTRNNGWCELSTEISTHPSYMEPCYDPYGGTLYAEISKEYKVGPNGMLWHYEICPELGDKKGSLQECKDACSQNGECTAFNFVSDTVKTKCELLKCPIPIPDPTWNFGNGWVGYSLNIGWPSGMYGLPRSNSGEMEGCPNGWWKSGYRYHDMEDQNNDNKWSTPNNLYGEHGSSKGVHQGFCLKDNANGTPWEKGDYCIYKFKGMDCPNGFSTGTILFDDEDKNNQNSNEGSLPDGSFGGNSKYIYCCRDDGSPDNAITLPTTQAFFLFPHTDKCQEVRGMISSLQWIFFDTEDNDRISKATGKHPRVEIGKNIKLYYCYYQ